MNTWEVELQHRHRIMHHALAVILEDADNAGFELTKARLQRLDDELQSNRPMQEWSLQRVLDGDDA